MPTSFYWPTVKSFSCAIAEPLHAWKDGDVYAGRDELLGGTWLAVNRYGEFAALTNASAAVPDASKQQNAEGEPASRGGVPLAIVDASRALETNLNRLGDSQFRPYFALAGDAVTCFYTHNIAGAHVEAVDTTQPQVLSNRPLAHSERQDPALALLEHLECQASPLSIEDLARTLDGHQPAERSVHLPIRANGFGTRCSTAVRIRGDICEICEISYNRRRGRNAQLARAVRTRLSLGAIPPKSKGSQPAQSL